MRVVCGADGCRGGWVALFKHLDSRAVTARLFRSFAELARCEPRPAVIAIDVPIGLPDGGARACDLAARRQLGRPRASSVFPAPIRAVLGARSHGEASARRFRVEGLRLSVQTWLIVPKIREVDAVLRRDRALRSRVHEAHPEVSFAILGGRPMRHNKKTQAGRREREWLLRRVFGAGVAKAVAQRAILRSGTDDVLDALALLWTAERIARRNALRLPDRPPHDRYGLRMEIVA